MLGKVQVSARCKVTFFVVVFRDKAGDDLNVENRQVLKLRSPFFETQTKVTFQDKNLRTLLKPKLRLLFV